MNKRADLNKAVQGGIFFKINKRAGQIPVHLQDGINVPGEFLHNNVKMQVHETFKTSSS